MWFDVLEVRDPRWETLFRALPLAQQDVFYAPGFARLCQETLNASDAVACAAYTNDAGALLLYPFVRRDVGALLGAEFAEGLFDTLSLYGRGGVVGVAEPDALEDFYVLLARYLVNNRVFCSFDRFHPVIGNHAAVSRQAQVRHVGGFVVVDLRPPLEDVLAACKQSVRKDMRKAERKGVTCFAEANCDHLGDFLEIYYQTMDRNAASDYYYFSEAFFTELSRLAEGQFHFFYAVHENRVVSCELVLHHGLYAHSFLGGTRRDALPLAANPLLKSEILRQMREIGCAYFLLGGGQRPNDGIYNFKQAYAPDGVFASYVGGTVWQPTLYEGLLRDISAAGRELSSGRFQFYDLS